jgi:hypothetical protein
MGLRSLFQRKPATTAPALTAPAGTVQDEPLSPELQKELQAAWAELTEAAKNSAVINFHACTRNGRPWTEDLAAVRAVAATLREFPSTDTQQPT